MRVGASQHAMLLLMFGARQNKLALFHRDLPSPQGLLSPMLIVALFLNNLVLTSMHSSSDQCFVIDNELKINDARKDNPT